MPLMYKVKEVDFMDAWCGVLCNEFCGMFPCMQDPQIGEDVRKEFEAILAKKKTPTNSKFYPGMHHGWTIRGDDSDPKQKEGAADAFAEMVAFLKKYGV